MQVLVGHPDYEVTGGSAIFKGEDLLDKEPAERSHNGLFLSFQSPVEIPGVSNMDFLRMACNARRAALSLPELGPLEVYHVHFMLSRMRIFFFTSTSMEVSEGGLHFLSVDLS